jgi:hypothetical protein
MALENVGVAAFSSEFDACQWVESVLSDDSFRLSFTATIFEQDSHEVSLPLLLCQWRCCRCAASAACAAHAALTAIAGDVAHVLLFALASCVCV